MKLDNQKKSNGKLNREKKNRENEKEITWLTNLLDKRTAIGLTIREHINKRKHIFIHSYLSWCGHFSSFSGLLHSFGAVHLCVCMFIFSFKRHCSQIPYPCHSSLATKVYTESEPLLGSGPGFHKDKSVTWPFDC